MAYKLTISQKEFWVRKRWIKSQSKQFGLHKHLYYDIFEKKDKVWRKWELLDGLDGKELFFGSIKDEAVMLIWFSGMGWKIASVKTLRSSSAWLSARQR